MDLEAWPQTPPQLNQEEPKKEVWRPPKDLESQKSYGTVNSTCSITKSLTNKIGENWNYFKNVTKKLSNKIGENLTDFRQATSEVCLDMRSRAISLLESKRLEYIVGNLCFLLLLGLAISAIPLLRAHFRSKPFQAKCCHKQYLCSDKNPCVPCCKDFYNPTPNKSKYDYVCENKTCNP